MVTINDALKASFGEANNTIRASFKKTVLIRQYETEVIELETTLNIERNLQGAERAFIVALLQIQLEYTAYATLLCKGLVTQEEFDKRKAELEQEVNILKQKAEGVLGRSLDYLVNCTI